MTDSEVKKKVLPSLVAICEDRGGGTRSRGWSASQHASEAPRKRHREKRGRSQSAGDRRAGSHDAAGARPRPTRARERREDAVPCAMKRSVVCGKWKLCGKVARAGGRRALFTAIGVGADGANGGLSAPCWPHSADVRMKGARNARFRFCRFGDRSRTVGALQSKKTRF